VKTKTYFYGDGHSKWGIWNNMRKEFQFGICEDTPLLAERKLRQKIGNDARKWRFEVKQLPCTTRQKESARICNERSRFMALRRTGKDIDR
jgi:hypothetical protein